MGDFFRVKICSICKPCTSNITFSGKKIPFTAATFSLEILSRAAENFAFSLSACPWVSPPDNELTNIVCFTAPNTVFSVQVSHFPFLDEYIDCSQKEMWLKCPIWAAEMVRKFITDSDSVYSWFLICYQLQTTSTVEFGCSIPPTLKPAQQNPQPVPQTYHFYNQFHYDSYQFHFPILFLVSQVAALQKTFLPKISSLHPVHYKLKFSILTIYYYPYKSWNFSLCNILYFSLN